MKQIGTQKFESEDKKFIVICENDMSLGLLHDYLLELKGNVVDMLSAAHKQERDAAEAVKKQDAEKAEAVEEVKAEEQK
jgi:hypothetical protein